MHFSSRPDSGEEEGDSVFSHSCVFEGDLSGGREGFICLCNARACICNVYICFEKCKFCFGVGYYACGISVFGDYSEEGEGRRGEAGVRDHKSVEDFYGRIRRYPFRLARSIFL